MVPTSFISLLHGNQFLAGGSVLMVIGGLLASLRSFPKKIGSWLFHKLTITFEVESTDEAFQWLVIWLHQHPYSKKARRIMVTSTNKSLNVSDPAHTFDEENLDTKKTIIFTPSRGNHFFWFNRTFIWLFRSKEDKKDNSSMVGKPIEKFEIQIFGKNQNVARNLIETARTAYEALSKEQAKFHISSYGYWKSVGLVKDRRMESVILPNTLSDKIVNDIKQFLNSRDWYKKIGVPYRRGYLLHGIPGSGKSSLVAAIAGEFKIDLYSCNLSGINITDDKLEELIADLKPPCILLFEDIDAVTTDRSKIKDEKKMGGVSLSGLLNILDGLLSQEGVITIMTTNFKDRLDEALVRPGRVDLEVKFEYATADQLIKLFDRFFPNNIGQSNEVISEIVKNHSISMAEMQQFLLIRRDNAEQAIADMSEKWGKNTVSEETTTISKRELTEIEV